MLNSLKKVIFNARMYRGVVFAVVVLLFFAGGSISAHAKNWGMLAEKWYYLGSDFKSDEWETKEQIEEGIRAINEVRAEFGLTPLQKDQVLMDAAEIRAKEIVGRFEHFRPDGSRPFTATNGVYQNVGENLGRWQPNTMEIMQDWMNSPEHRKNILYADYDKIGIATYREDGKTYWVHLFMAE